MNKKGSMELSVNSIVILVIAITMLGLILGFVNSKFNGLDKQLTTQEPDAPQATADEPITMSRSVLAVSPGETVALKFSIYNINAAATGVKPTFMSSGTTTSCKPSTLSITESAINAKNIAAGASESYDGIFKVNGATKGKYLCVLSATPTPSGGIPISKEIIVNVQ